MSQTLPSMLKFVILGVILFASPGCHFFKKDRYKVVNGMKFQTLKLKNDLQVLTISDDRFVKSSAALAVMAGSMQNPDEHLGLAHFLEHMLFLGTEEFPKVGDYEDYLNKNGGGHNAYTSIDHTNYFFDINHPAFSGALDRFSRFFVSPTFDPKYVDREKNAVHSEHEKNRKDDSRREYRIQQVISLQEHPFAKFATGDKDTLAKADRAAVMDFYKKKYSSNLMRLVLMSNESPETLKKLAEQYFSDIPNAQLSRPEYSEKVFPEQGLPRKIEVKSIRDHEIMKVSFAIPDETPYWKGKPANMLAHLIGDEGEGSLLSYLKKKGWALSLGTSTWWRSFNVRMTLTEAGKENAGEILKALFSYIKLVNEKGLPSYLFEERKVLAEIELDNIEPKSSMSRASDFSASMLYYNADHFLQEHYLFHEFSKKDFEHFLSFLRLDNMQVTLFSRDAKTQKSEEYYGIDYGLSTLDKKFSEELKAITVYPELALPKPNPYIPKKLDLVKSPKVYEPTEEEYKGKATIFHQIDTDLRIPKASIAFALSSDFIKGDPKTYLTAQLYSLAKRQELNEWGYPARLAGLNYNVSHGNNTVTLEVSGFNENLSVLLEKLIEDKENNRRIDRVTLDPELFKKIKNKYKKNLMNTEYDAAYQQLFYESNVLFSTGAIHRSRYRDLVDQITLEMINEFAGAFFKKVAITAYGFGNLEIGQVREVVDYYLKTMSTDTYSREDVKKFESRYVSLPDGHHVHSLRGMNNNNSLYTVYRATPWTIENHAYTEVLSKLVEQPYFTELRTHQQLGYIVAAFGSTGNGFCGLGTLIQSQGTLPLDIFKKSDTFIKTLLEKLKTEIKDADIAPVKAALIAELSRQPNTLNERLSRFSTMASTYHGDFNFYKKLQKYLSEIDAEKLKVFVEKNLVSRQEKTQMTFLYYSSEAQSEKLPDTMKLIPSLEDFKKSQPHIHPYRESKNM